MTNEQVQKIKGHLFDRFSETVISGYTLVDNQGVPMDRTEYREVYLTAVLEYVAMTCDAHLANESEITEEIWAKKLDEMKTKLEALFNAQTERRIRIMASPMGQVLRALGYKG